MRTQLEGLCSMATRALLEDLCEAVARRRSLAVHFLAAGGVDVVRQIRGGSTADIAILSTGQVEQLETDGLLAAGTIRPLFVSEVVVGVPDVAPSVQLSSEEDLRAVLLRARRIAYSTGPSGEALTDLLVRWNLEGTLRHKLVQAVPGRSVATLLVAGEAELGFQQRSELSNHTGVRVLGPLPGSAAIRSTFCGAVLASSSQVDLALDVLDFLGSAEVTNVVETAGMARA